MNKRKRIIYRTQGDGRTHVAVLDDVIIGTVYGLGDDWRAYYLGGGVSEHPSKPAAAKALKKAFLAPKPAARADVKESSKNT